MKLRKNDAILVKWEDIAQYYDWNPETDAENKPAITCLTLGFYLNKTKRWLRVSDTMCSDGDRNVTVIPLGCILKIRKWNRVKS